MLDECEPPAGVVGAHHEAVVQEPGFSYDLAVVRAEHPHAGGGCSVRLVVSRHGRDLPIGGLHEQAFG